MTDGRLTEERSLYTLQGDELRVLGLPPGTRPCCGGIHHDSFLGT